ncbi:hypothetical protein HanIR_Chr06g0266811 [Helianthus annuus]|nr:hypothetical protein HanIR_Chr06g0266811 [Helianthus annuus]
MRRRVYTSFYICAKSVTVAISLFFISLETCAFSLFIYISIITNILYLSLYLYLSKSKR